MRNLLIALLLVFVFGCHQPVDSPAATGDDTESRGGTVVIGVLSDIQNWNPYLGETAHTEEVLALIYPSLAIEQTDYHKHPPSFSPSLAQSWEFSADHLSLTLKLDPDAVWSDGVPLTSADVVFSWQVQVSPDVGWPQALIKDYITSVEAVDPHTVRFVFDHVYPYQMMDANDGLIVPAHSWSKIPFDTWADTDWSGHVLSATPFIKAEHTRMQELVLERNPSYWKPGIPLLDRVVWRIVPDQTNLLIQLRSGAIDYMKGLPADQIARIDEDPEINTITFKDRGYALICWNTSRPLFNNVRVRQALTLAIDRQAIIDTVYRGRTGPSIGPILSNMWAFNRALKPLPYSIEAAKKMLKEAGWADHDGDGLIDRDGHTFSFEMLAPAENRERQDISVLIQQNLARVGIIATPRTAEWGTLLQRLHTGDFDGVVHRWIEPTQIDLNEVWHSAVEGEFTLNYSHFSNNEVDQLLSEADMAGDFATQKPLFDRIQEIIVAEQPYTFLLESVRVDGLNARVHGAIINDAGPYFNLEQWSVTGK